MEETVRERDCFETEDALVAEFVLALSDADAGACLPAERIICEFSFVRGKPDVVSVSVDGEVVAFEAKLTRWRDALAQAYRNTCFAHRSFVVLPSATARRAARFCGEFRRRGVGLCVVDDGRITIIHEAVRREPVEPWLSARFCAAARGQTT